MEQKNLIIHHKDCPDGFCAAYVAHKKFPDAELLAVDHGGEIPYEKIKDRDVLVVDFSWRTKDICRQLKDLSKSFHILDHHKSAQEVLDGEDYATFDMNRSGAGITWDTLFSKPRPWYVNYVEDRDLWKWQLLDSKEVNAFIGVFPHTIKDWDQLSKTDWDQASEHGSILLLHIKQYIERAIARKRIGSLDGYSAAVVNAPYMMISDVCERLLDFADIAVGYFEREDDKIQLSLRSKGELDVSKIAQSFNGGGHKNAAGFQVPYKKGREIVDSILGRA